MVTKMNNCKEKTKMIRWVKRLMEMNGKARSW